MLLNPFRIGRFFFLFIVNFFTNVMIGASNGGNLEIIELMINKGANTWERFHFFLVNIQSL